MNTSENIQTLLIAFAEKLGIGPLATGEDGVSVLSFEEVDLLLTSDAQSMTLFARLGTAPAGDTDLLETLLAANLFWQETQGATLSLEPYSRMVVIAQRIAASEVQTLEMLETAIESFARSAIEWSRTIRALEAEGGTDATASSALPASAQRA